MLLIQDLGRKAYQDYTLEADSRGITKSSQC